MLNDGQVRDSLNNLIIKYLKDKDPETDQLIKVVKDRSRPLPIKGILERIKKYDHPPFTRQELDTIEYILYAHG
ncbi:hypothetical protein PSCICJ_31140 [Pseudomonas cichorii]|nr:hypothetical protein PSCICJ_31140 [Pseudomonas cichorii]